jgi:hypothetical protein
MIKIISKHLFEDMKLLHCVKVTGIYIFVMTLVISLLYPDYFDF